MPYEKIFKGDGSTFSALYEAEKWLSDNGYSYGPMSRQAGQGVLKGSGINIAKMHNLTKKEIKELDGVLYAGREGDARLLLKEPPESEAA